MRRVSHSAKRGTRRVRESLEQNNKTCTGHGCARKESEFIMYIPYIRYGETAVNNRLKLSLSFCFTSSSASLLRSMSHQWKISGPTTILEPVDFKK